MLPIPGFSEVISIEYDTVPTMHIDMSTDVEVLRLIVLFPLQAHARVDGVDSLFRQFLFVE